MTSNFMYKNFGGYRNMVRMSAFKYILVEGRDDKRTLMYLKQDLFGKRPDLRIHSVEDINFNNGKGNRENVEDTCAKISKYKYAERFIGFVDREFRGFDLQTSIVDLIGTHKIIDHLVWSRGHSIENYFFDFAILSKPLRDHSVTLYFEEALDLFQDNLEQILRGACAIGLAALECNLLEVVRHSIADWSLIDLNTSGIAINTTDWLNVLLKKQKIRQKDANDLITSFNNWFLKISTITLDVIRWLCDGHTGITFLWAAFARCVFEISQKLGNVNPQLEATKVLKSDQSVRFNACASEWASQTKSNTCEYPKEIFTLLGIT